MDDRGPLWRSAVGNPHDGHFARCCTSARNAPTSSDSRCAIRRSNAERASPSGSAKACGVSIPTMAIFCSTDAWVAAAFPVCRWTRV